MDIKLLQTFCNRHLRTRNSILQLAAFSFAQQLLPQEYSTVTHNQPIPLLDSAALNSLGHHKKHPAQNLNNGSAVFRTIIKDNLLISGSYDKHY